MTRALILIAALLAAGAYVQTARLGAARADLSEARAGRDAALHAAKVLGTYYTTLETERERWAAIEADLNTEEGADAPLSDYGRAVLDRVRAP